MSKRPAAVIAIFFISGVVLARFLPESVKFLHIFMVILIFITLTLTLSLKRERGYRRDIFLLLSVTSFAALLYVNSNSFPNNHISHVLKEEKLKTEIIGIIKSPALTRKPYYGKINSAYLFEVESIRSVKCKVLSVKHDGEDDWCRVEGLAQIRIGTEKDYEYGDRLMVKGTIKKPSEGVIARAKPEAISGIASSSRHQKLSGLLAMTKKKDFNYREYLEMQNIWALITTKESSVTILSHNYKANPVLKYTYLLREKLNNRILEKMPLESGAFLAAILLGDRSELPKDIQTAFKNSGTMHILAVSGLHVGIIVMVMIYALKFLRIGRAFSYPFTILCIIFFGLLTLSRPSAVRAVVMASVFLTGLLLGRKADPYNSLGAAAIFILIKNPKDCFNVGFQLSFVAVLSILYFTPKLIKLIRPDTNLYIRKYFYMPFFVSISASVGTAPFILYYFGIITPIAIISNLFVIPALSILLIGGMAFFLLGWLPFVGAFLAGFNNVVASVIFNAADFFSSLKFGHFYLG